MYSFYLESGLYDCIFNYFFLHLCTLIFLILALSCVRGGVAEF